MARSVYRTASLSACVALAVSSRAVNAEAAPKRGDFLQTDTLSMNLLSRDFTTQTTTSVADAVNLSGLVGIHYYFVDRVRFGVSMQTTLRLWPEPEPDSSRVQRLGFYPQLGWNFADPFFAGLLFSYAPRTRGKAIPDMSVSPLLGVSLPLSSSVRWSFAVEAPWAFYYHQTLSLVALTGVGFRL
ncbi:MAG: hypothetical protein ACOY0T_34610 [Myxococcota bacterium]